MERRHALALVAVLLLTLAALAAPALTQAGGGCHGAVTPPGDGEASVVKVDGCMFFPTIARVPVGTTVRFLNTGNAPHNITGVVGSWASPLLETGQEYQHRFAAPGVYPFACTLHPGMNGAVVVGDEPAAAAELAVTTQPAPVAQAAPDMSPLAMVGLGGLAAGIVLGLGIALLRPRPTD